MIILFNRYLYEGILPTFLQVFALRINYPVEKQIILSDCIENIYKVHHISSSKYKKLTKKIFKEILNSPLLSTLDHNERAKEIISE
jgi:hypothetical protein